MKKNKKSACFLFLNHIYFAASPIRQGCLKKRIRNLGATKFRFEKNEKKLKKVLDKGF